MPESDRKPVASSLEGNSPQHAAPQLGFLERLVSLPLPLLADGAMGTMLHARGIGFDRCFDELNLSQPSLVADIHREYIDAGAAFIQTNSFGANRYKLATHGLGDKVLEINRSAVDLARRVVLASFKDVFIAGDVGPTGVRLAPYGRVQPEDVRVAFIEQVEALTSSGVDLLILETFSDLNEILQAVAAARQVCTLPLVASLTFTRDDLTLMGESPSTVVAALQDAGVDVIGVNCSSGPTQALRILKHMHAALPGGYFSAMPNAGWPEQVADRMMYPASPDYFAEFAQQVAQVGAALIGGCCGTTPRHIAAMHAALRSERLLTRQNDSDAITLVSAPPEKPVSTPSRLAHKLESGELVVAVEMDPPHGLTTHKLIAAASLLAEAGADVINVADSPMARMRMSPWAVCSLIQEKLKIETTLHFPTRGRNLLRIQGDLLAAHAMHIRNVFVVMGDLTEIGDYPDAMDNFDLVPSGLIKLIKQGFNLGVDHSGVEIGQPTSFFVGCALNLNSPQPDRELRNLHRKLTAGADFILTQPVFDVASAERMLHQYHQSYGDLNVPILAGVLPLYSWKHANFLQNEVPGIVIPPEILTRMKEAGEDASHAGLRIAEQLARHMRHWAAGFYLIPAFNRFDLAADLIESLKSL
jgi:methionine synthase / methylenetetrahydrofolate reductase(NADPH)